MVGAVAGAAVGAAEVLIGPAAAGQLQL